MPLPRWSWAPPDVTGTQRQNFVKVQVDAVGVGFASSAQPYLPVFLTRLGATNFQVGLLTSMPAMTGLALALFIGQFLQSRRRIVPWFSAARLTVLSCYALTGLLAFFVPREHLVTAVLVLWAVVTVPQTALNICFTVVMSTVAGPAHRYDLMSRRWSIIGLTYAATVAIVGQLLDRIGFPLNYQVAFMGLSLGGLLSFYFSSRIELPPAERPARPPGRSAAERLRGYVGLILGQRAFVHFSVRRFVFLLGSMFGLPLFPLYYVRDVQASDAWIGLINTVQTGLMLVGYLVFARASRTRGSRFVLVWATLIVSLHPALAATTGRVELLALLAGLAGIFQAGLDLVFFDELMRTVPPEHSATFASIAHSLTYLATVLGPTAGTLLADQIGLTGALLTAAVLRLTGFALFAFWPAPKAAPAQTAASAEPAQPAGK
jgi:predicted MFS family arabinose efflux permease